MPYQLHVLPFPPRVLSKPYRQINPLGTVPFLIDGNATMTESAAMCQYLAARYSSDELDVRANSEDFASYLNYLHFGEATLTFPQTLVLRYRYFESEDRRLPQVADDYAQWFLARLRNIDQRLADRQWLCCNRFTAADISVGYALLLASHIDLDKSFSPTVMDYWKRLQDRPGYQRAQTAQVDAAVQQGVSPTPAPRTGPPARPVRA